MIQIQFDCLDIVSFLSLQFAQARPDAKYPDVRAVLEVILLAIVTAHRAHRPIIAQRAD